LALSSRMDWFHDLNALSNKMRTGALFIVDNGRLKTASKAERTNLCLQDVEILDSCWRNDESCDSYRIHLMSRHRVLDLEAT
jgi:hypothetical protein